MPWFGRTVRRRISSELRRQSVVGWSAGQASISLAAAAATERQTFLA
jgi:hypothetical protein